PYTVIQLPGSDGLEAIADALGLGERGAEQLLAEVDHQRKARHRAETSVADLKIRVAELERLVAGGESARGGLAVEVDWAASMPEPPMVAPADQPTVVSMGSERLAEVLGEHAIYVDKLERALAEAREYAEEMVEDRAQVERQLGDARRELEAEKARVVTMRGQIGDWRDRAARAEGQLLRANLERGSALVTSKLDIEGARKRLSEAEELLGEQLSVARELESLAGELASETAAGSDDLEAAAAAGNREAEVALLTVGLRSLKSRLRELADELAGARQEGADELAGAVVRTIARLRNFSRD
ncbi:MAG: hypothetical protein KJO07_23805, partial [Deltaproteobacteria bacterium]|nr:hypothetical protein [Deltaproteobacteria bacterium]